MTSATTTPGDGPPDQRSTDGRSTADGVAAGLDGTTRQADPLPPGTTVAVVPIRSLRNGKTRLAAALPEAARAALTRRMLGGVVGAALGSGAVGAVVVVSPDPAALDLAATLDPAVVPLAQDLSAPGLNPALAQARAWALARGAAALLVLFGDLPLLAAEDVRALVGRPAPVVLAPDRHGLGTNALLLRFGLSATDAGTTGTAAAPGTSRVTAPAEGFRFGFGADSYARHAAEADRLGLAVATVVTAGTALDLDTPADWHALAGDGESLEASHRRHRWDGALAAIAEVDS